MRDYWKPCVVTDHFDTSIMVQLGEEERSGFKVSNQMKKVWGIQLLMTQYILDVCEKHNLKIWVASGTLLGAVRHQGYIPWDDDIDLIMFREDYDKLVSLSRDEIKHPFFLQSAYTENEYCRGHAQLRYANTAAILPQDIHRDIDQSIFIDIFVYDAIPDVEDIQWRRTLRKAILLRKIMDVRVCNIELNLHFRSFVKYIVQKILLRTGLKSLSMFKAYESLFKRYRIQDHRRMSYHAFSPNFAYLYIFQKEWYAQTIMLPFENIFVPVPKDFQKVLEVEYGRDYMTPKQVPSMHGGGVIFSTDTSYKDLLPALRQQCK